jgi:hypothetical protein
LIAAKFNDALPLFAALRFGRNDRWLLVLVGLIRGRFLSGSSGFLSASLDLSRMFGGRQAQHHDFWLGFLGDRSRRMPPVEIAFASRNAIGQSESYSCGQRLFRANRKRIFRP